MTYLTHNHFARFALFLIAAVCLGAATVPALAQGGDIGIYTDATGTDCHLLDIVPSLLEYYVVQNNTSGASGVAFTATVPSAMTASGVIYLGDVYPLGLRIGDTQTGVEVAYGACLAGPIHIATIQMFSVNGATPACTSYPVTAHPTEGLVSFDCSAIPNLEPVVGLTSTINGTAACDCAADQDLEVTVFSAPASADLGEDVSGSLSFQIQNSGTSDINTEFSAAVYFSTDDVITTDDKYVTGSRLTVPSLAAGLTADSDFFTAVIPSDIPSGPGYLGVVVDEFDAIAEVDELNNTASSAITINPPTTTGRVVAYFDADLTQTSKACPGLGVDTLYIAVEDLGVFISGIEYSISYPSSMNFLTDIPMRPVSIGTSPNGISIAGAVPFFSLEQALIEKVVFAWTCVDCSGGQEEVSINPHPDFGQIAAVDFVSGDYIYPAGETSYTCSSDLEVVSFSTTDGAARQEDIAALITLLIRNNGAPIVDTFDVGLYHSLDTTIDPGDLFVSRRTITGGLASGDTLVVSFTTAKLPYETPLGSGFMGVILDEFNVIGEDDEGGEDDNTASSPIFIEPAADIGEIAVYFDDDLTMRTADCPGAGFSTLYVVVEGLNRVITGTEYKINYPAQMTFVQDFDLPPVYIGSSDVGISVAYGAATSVSGKHLIHKVLVDWSCDDCEQFDTPLQPSAHPSGLIGSIEYSTDDVIPHAGAVSTICADDDGDGVFNGPDLCPSVNAAPYDVDGDGCVDLTAGNRRVEYWETDDFPIHYVINQNGAAGISNGSDLADVQAGLATWNTVPNTVAQFAYDGTTVDKEAVAGDFVNLVTFEDSDYQFPSGVLAVGVATSLEEPTFIEGELYRKGQIIDFDMIFNKLIKFKTNTDGDPNGLPILGVTVHEAGHGLGISHSIVQTSTMAYVLTPGAETLEAEDELTAFMHYGDPVDVANASQLGGTITDGLTMDPIGGAIVFAINAASGDTSGCAVTRDDGSYIFVGLPDGNYYVACHPLDGSSTIKFIQPGNINPVVGALPFVDFVPESWDDAEGNMDNSNDRDPIPVVAGIPALGYNIETNIDATPPFVATVFPADEAMDLPIGTAVLIKFSESINPASAAGQITLVDTAASDTLSLANKSFISLDDSLITLLPAFDFERVYKLHIKSGVTDAFNNPMTADFISHFKTQAAPAVAINTLVPASGPVGTVVTVDGDGFSTSGQNEVRFDGVLSSIVSQSAEEILAVVPTGATSGQVVVTNLEQTPGSKDSNPFPFTVLVPKSASQGSDAGSSDVGALPRDMTLLPDAKHAYVATSLGYAVVQTDANLNTFLDAESFVYVGGLDGIDANSTGSKVYAVSSNNKKLVSITTGETPSISNERGMTDEPLGILVGPSGRRAFVPTDAGEITIWDLNAAHVATFETQIGVIEADPNLRGELATAAFGTNSYLLALSASGRLQVFDLAGDSLKAQVTVGYNPRGVATNPQGDLAYVTDFSGRIDVVKMADFTKLTTITTGGSLRDAAITPDGSFLFAVNRELNVFNVIDLRPESGTFYKVVGSPTLGINPTSTAIGSDGLFAFATAEMDESLNAIAIGLGSTLETVVPRAAPVGSPLVLAGSGFAQDELTEVSFDGLIVPPEVLTDSTIVVTVPVGASDGPITVRGTNAVGPQTISNAIFFDVLGGATPAGGIRLAGGAAVPGEFLLSLDASPTGNLIAVGGTSGGEGAAVHFLDNDPASGTFNEFFQTSEYVSGINDVAMSPDGLRTFTMGEGFIDVDVVNSDRFSSDFGDAVGQVNLTNTAGSYIQRLIVHPDGRRLYVSDPGRGSVRVIDIELGSPAVYTEIDEIPLGNGSNGAALEMAFHPAGRYLYCAGQDVSNPEIIIVDVVLGSIVGDEPIAGGTEIPMSLAFTPDGDVCLALTSADGARTLRAYDTSTPTNPSPLGTVGIATTENVKPENVHISPQGDRALVNIFNSGYHYFNISNPNAISLIEVAGNAAHHVDNVEFDYTVGGAGFYSVSAAQDSAFAQDFAEPQSLSLLDGNNQSGIAGQPLGNSLRVKATETGSGSPASGVAVKFKVTAGSGLFVGPESNTQTVLTNASGIAAVKLRLGPEIGAGVHGVSATASGLTGSPVQFTASADADPETLPLVILTVAPTDGASDVAVTTNLQTKFRRKVNTATVSSSTFRLLDEAMMIVPVSYGFADQDRRVSMTPVTPLQPGKTYTIEMTDGIKALDGTPLRASNGDPLTAPIATTFDTEPPPPLALNSVDPPSGVAGVPIVISGVGISDVPAENSVVFPPGVPAVVTESGPDFIKVNVPLGAVSGPVEVERLITAATSGGPSASSAAPQTIDFVVLVPVEEAADEVIGNVGTGNTSTRSLSITPDGARAYATGENSVVKIDVLNLTSGDPIPVGSDPVSIVVSPDGAFAYVANNGSGTVSIIDIDPASAGYETDITTVNVGLSPLDVAIHPDGDILYVANAGSNDISLVDTDEFSKTFHAVIGNIGGGGTTTRSLSITPDGAKLFVGGEGDITIISTLSNAVIGSVGTGNTTTRSLSITPDGAKLVALTVAGRIVVYDIVPNSPTENQVLGTFGGGGNQQTRSLSITPDGAQIWAIQELDDDIVVLSLDFTGGIGVLDVPETAVELTVVDVVEAGEDPAFVIFDPTGSGTALVTNPGDKTVTLLQPSAAPLSATLELDPGVVTVWNPNPDDEGGGEGIHLKSSDIRFINATIELPVEPLVYAPVDVAQNTVRLFDEMQDMFGRPVDASEGGILADQNDFFIDDSNENGVEELHVKFDRLQLQLTVPQGEAVPVMVLGRVDGRRFVCRDTVETTGPKVVAPTAGASYGPNETINIAWTSPPGVRVDAVDVYWTPNDGKDWHPIAEKIPDSGSLKWKTPEGYHPACRIAVIIYRARQKGGVGISEAMFKIGAPPSVAMGDVRISAMERKARIQWDIGGADVDGFYVLRSMEKEGNYKPISTGVVGKTAVGDGYQFDDEDVRLNETYYYKLQEVDKGRAGHAFGPYEFVYAARFALHQNAPNPFNPTTVIKFTIPQASHVKLVIYDVAGRRVRDLINGKRDANFYEVTWDGRDTNGMPVASGVYFYRLQAGKHQATKKMVMLK